MRLTRPGSGCSNSSANSAIYENLLAGIATPALRQMIDERETEKARLISRTATVDRGGLASLASNAIRSAGPVSGADRRPAHHPGRSCGTRAGCINHVAAYRKRDDLSG
jgi:hypothetical protein